MVVNMAQSEKKVLGFLEEFLSETLILGLEAIFYKA